MYFLSGKFFVVGIQQSNFIVGSCQYVGAITVLFICYTFHIYNLPGTIKRTVSQQGNLLPISILITNVSRTHIDRLRHHRCIFPLTCYITTDTMLPRYYSFTSGIRYHLCQQLTISFTVSRIKTHLCICNRLSVTSIQCSDFHTTIAQIQS